MILRILVVGVFLIVTTPAVAQVDHSPFGVVLERHLRNDLFDYGAVHADRSMLNSYLDALARTDAQALSRVSQAHQLAFWINAYNACALQIVLDNYPIARRGVLVRIVNLVKGYPANSIQQIPNRWDGKYCTVAGQERSLDDIEHGIIRPMGDPRIHFAVNCASRSCPSLAAEPYHGERLDEQLDRAVRDFVANPRHFEIQREQPQLILNKVLDWYKDDFGGIDGVKTLLARYLPDADASFLRENPGLRVSFHEYDWTLNDTAVFEHPSSN